MRGVVSALKSYVKNVMIVLIVIMLTITILWHLEWYYDDFLNEIERFGSFTGSK